MDKNTNADFIEKADSFLKLKQVKNLLEGVLSELYIDSEEISKLKNLEPEEASILADVYTLTNFAHNILKSLLSGYITFYEYRELRELNDNLGDAINNPKIVNLLKRKVKLANENIQNELSESFAEKENPYNTLLNKRFKQWEHNSPNTFTKFIQRWIKEKRNRIFIN